MVNIECIYRNPVVSWLVDKEVIVQDVIVLQQGLL